MLVTLRVMPIPVSTAEWSYDPPKQDFRVLPWQQPQVLGLDLSNMLKFRIWQILPVGRDGHTGTVSFGKGQHEDLWWSLHRAQELEGKQNSAVYKPLTTDAVVHLSPRVSLGCRAELGMRLRTHRPNALLFKLTPSSPLESSYRH